VGAIPLFWQFQIGGWAIHAVLTLPVKIGWYPSTRDAIVVSLVGEPLGFLMTCVLRMVYLRDGLFGLDVARNKPRRLVVLVPLICLIPSAVELGISSPINRLLGLEVSWLIVFGQTWLRYVQYLAWSFLYFWIKGVIAARTRAVNLIRAETAAREAELRMLRAQIDPHFLFNALNTVLAGIRPDQKSLTNVVQGLADYLRYSLANRHATMVPLGDEFDAAMNYLTVEKARFHDDLQVDAHIDPVARSLPVPGVMLQPLIENAVKYGYRSSPVPLRVRVDVRADGAAGAIIEVANTGRWIDRPLPRPDGDASGVGLESLRRRLDLLYDGSHEFEISADESRVVVRIRLPATPALASA
jgi:signal transduction histidine kinase